MNIYQSLISSYSDYQKTFCFISAFEGRLPIAAIKIGWPLARCMKYGCFLSHSFFYSNLPSAKQIALPCCQSGLKHSAGGYGLNSGIDQRRFIPPFWGITPEYRVRMELFATFAEQYTFVPSATLYRSIGSES